MQINGNVSIATYFILNKRDRTGKGILRPFHAVLEDMKREETEKAKMKQTSSLKGSNEQSQTTAPAPLLTINESEPMTPAPAPPPPPVPGPTPARESLEIPISMKPTETNGNDSSLDHRSSFAPTRSSNDPPDKTYPMINEQNDPTAIFGRQSRSKTCELL